MSEENLHLFMSEDSTPYEDDRNPYIRTEDDEKFYHQLIQELETTNTNQKAV